MTDFKEQGNRLFSERRYTEAIEAYTSAIVSTLYSVGARDYGIEYVCRISVLGLLPTIQTVPCVT